MADQNPNQPKTDKTDPKRDIIDPFIYLGTWDAEQQVWKHQNVL